MAPIDRFDEQLRFFDKPAGRLLTRVWSGAVTYEEVLRELAAGVGIRVPKRLDRRTSFKRLDELATAGFGVAL